jgi:hypothetical protein
MNVSILKAIRYARATFFNQINIHRWMSAPVTGQEIGEHGFDMLRAASDPQGPGFAAFQCMCPLKKNFRFPQQLAAASQQVFAFRCQSDPASDPIKQPDAEFSLERLDLPRSSRLTQMKSLLGASKTPSFCDKNEGL